MLMLLLIFVLRLLELVDSALELSMCFLIVFLGSVFLLLEEFKLSFPESLLLFKFTLKIGMLSFHVDKLYLPFLSLLTSFTVPVLIFFVDLINCLSQLKNSVLLCLYEIVLIFFEVLVLLSLHCSVSLHLGLGYLHLLFKFFVCLSFLFVLGVNIFFFLLNS